MAGGPDDFEGDYEENDGYSQNNDDGDDLSRDDIKDFKDKYDKWKNKKESPNGGKKGGEEAAKKSGQEGAKKTGEEAAGKGLEKGAKEGTKQAGKEAGKQAGKEVAKQAGKEAAKQGAKVAAEAAAASTGVGILVDLAIEAALLIRKGIKKIDNKLEESGYSVKEVKTMMKISPFLIALLAPIVILILIYSLLYVSELDQIEVYKKAIECAESSTGCTELMGETSTITGRGKELIFFNTAERVILAGEIEVFELKHQVKSIVTSAITATILGDDANNLLSAAAAENSDYEEVANGDKSVDEKVSIILLAKALELPQKYFNNIEWTIVKGDGTILENVRHGISAWNETLDLDKETKTLWIPKPENYGMDAKKYVSLLEGYIPDWIEPIVLYKQTGDMNLVDGLIDTYIDYRPKVKLFQLKDEKITGTTYKQQDYHIIGLNYTDAGYTITVNNKTDNTSTSEKVSLMDQYSIYNFKDLYRRGVTSDESSTTTKTNGNTTTTTTITVKKDACYNFDVNIAQYLIDKADGKITDGFNSVAKTYWFNAYVEDPFDPNNMTETVEEVVDEVKYTYNVVVEQAYSWTEKVSIVTEKYEKKTPDGDFNDIAYPVTASVGAKKDYEKTATTNDASKIIKALSTYNIYTNGGSLSLSGLTEDDLKSATSTNKLENKDIKTTIVLSATLSDRLEHLHGQKYVKTQTIVDRIRVTSTTSEIYKDTHITVAKEEDKIIDNRFEYICNELFDDIGGTKKYTRDDLIIAVELVKQYYNYTISGGSYTGEQISGDFGIKSGENGSSTTYHFPMTEEDTKYAILQNSTYGRSYGYSGHSGIDISYYYSNADISKVIGEPAKSIYVKGPALYTLTTGTLLDVGYCTYNKWYGTGTYQTEGYDGKLSLTNSGFGCYVKLKLKDYSVNGIEYPNAIIIYAHLYPDKTFLKGLSEQVGQEIPAGTMIGYMGNTGNSSGLHLHIEVGKTGWVGSGSQNGSATLEYLRAN